MEHMAFPLEQLPLQHTGLGFMCSDELLSQPPQLWDCPAPEGAKQGHEQGKGCPEVFPVHKLGLLSRALLEVALGLASAGTALAGVGVGCDHGDLGCLARLLCQTAPSAVSRLCSLGLN